MILLPISEEDISRMAGKYDDRKTADRDAATKALTIQKGCTTKVDNTIFFIFFTYFGKPKNLKKKKAFLFTKIF